MQHRWTFSVLALFSCFLAAVRGQSMDPEVNITETDPPSVGYRVYGQIASDVLLSCFVEDLPDELQVRWQRTMYDKDGRETSQLISIDMDVKDNNKWSIEKPTGYTWRLRIKALHVHDEGNYTCYVELTGNNNRAESNRTVFSYATPLILESESSSDMSVKEGDFVPLRCNATGRPQPTIMWRRQGNAIMPGGGVRHIGAEYNIQNVEYTARGLYICEALNDVGTDRRDITLTIQHAPKLSVDDDEVGQAVGYQRTLICYIDANPSPDISEENGQIYWMKGNNRVQPSSSVEFRAMMGAYDRVTYELTIFRVSHDDYGEYTCHARTNIGTGDPASVVLYETDEPQEDKKGEISSASRHVLTTTQTILTSLFYMILLTVLRGYV